MNMMLDNVFVCNYLLTCNDNITTNVYALNDTCRCIQRTKKPCDIDCSRIQTRSHPSSCIVTKAGIFTTLLSCCDYVRWRADDLFSCRRVSVANKMLNWPAPGPAIYCYVRTFSATEVAGASPLNLFSVIPTR